MTVQQNLDFDFGTALAAGARLAGFLALVAVMVPVHVVYSALKPQDAFRTPIIFHRLLIRILGFRVRVHGAMATARPVLFVSNHSSYLDITVLGTIIPGAFVAKADVRSWPLFGMLARLQHTLFIERRSSRTLEQKDGMRKRFEAGHNLILFPEGTSSDGLRVLPFKSGLFSALENESIAVTVQPVSVICTEIDDLPITRCMRPYYAWYGDMTLTGHLWNVFKFGRFTVDVVFHPPLSPKAFPDRKALAAHCQQQVTHGIEQCLTGRNFESAAILTAPQH